MSHSSYATAAHFDMNGTQGTARIHRDGVECANRPAHFGVLLGRRLDKLAVAPKERFRMAGAYRFCEYGGNRDQRGKKKDGVGHGSGFGIFTGLR